MPSVRTHPSKHNRKENKSLSFSLSRLWWVSSFYFVLRAPFLKTHTIPHIQTHTHTHPEPLHIKYSISHTPMASYFLKACGAYSSHKCSIFLSLFFSLCLAWPLSLSPFVIPTHTHIQNNTAAPIDLDSPLPLAALTNTQSFPCQLSWSLCFVS